MAKRKSKKRIPAKKTLLNLFLCLILLICAISYYQWKTHQYYRLNRQNHIEKINNLNSSKYKSEEMLRPVVKMDTVLGTGSGVIIHKDLDTYYIITNYHVIDLRANFTLQIDGLRGIGSYINPDPGITIEYFDNVGNKPIDPFNGKVIAESQELDLAILSFESKQSLCVAKLADAEVINNIDVFDTVYAVGCQLAIYPIPTQGIISRIINEKYFVGFNNSAQITLGSSGGGVFKLHEDHYYLIGISNKAAANYYQFFPHYAYAISIKSVRRFLSDSQLDFILN